MPLFLFPVNNSPAGTDKTLTSNEDTTYTINLSDFGFSDPNNTPANALSQVKITTLPTAGTLKLNGINVIAGDFISGADITAGKLTFTPATNANGLGYASLTFQVQDNGGTANGGIDLDHSPNTLTFNITPVNDAPTGAPTAILTAGTEDTPYTINTSALLQGFSDVDGDPLSVANLSATNGTLVNNNNGTYTFNPNANYNGTVNLSYNVIDGNGGSVAATQSFNLTPVNDAPTGSPTAILAAGTEDTLYTINTSALLQGFSDVDGDPLSVANLTATNGTLINNNNGTYTFNPSANYNGTVNLSYNVIDGNGGSIAATRTFSLTPVNDAPTGTPTAVLPNGTQGSPYTINTSALLQGFSDVDGDPLSVANLSATNGTLINNNNGTYTFTPNANYNGIVNLSHNVVDGNGGSIATPQTFSLGAAVNHPPVGTPTAALSSGTEDTPYTINVSALLQGFSDVDGDPLSITNLSATNGTLVNNGNGTYSFTPTANYNGPVNLTYNVIDGNGGSIAAAQSFSLAAVNDLPTANNDSATTTLNNAIIINLLANDSDIDGVLVPSTVTILSNPSNGTVTLNTSTGAATYTPSTNFTGTDSFTYTVQDNENGISNTATVNITVNAVNPVILGTNKNDTLTGGSGNDQIYGKGGNDILIGNDGDDLLDGGNGNDTLTGELGNDTYVVNTLKDIITENSGEGTDTVKSSISWTLGNNLENLTLTGTKSIKGTGNALDNVLTGNIGNNILDGGAGNDTLIGGMGNDTYIVDSTNDSIIELLNEGTDTVKSSVSWTLGANLENLTLTGTSSLSGTGNTLDNLMVANSAGSILNGGDGNDTLTGGIGNDTLFGGNGNDSLVGGLGSDLFTGGTGNDTLALGSDNNVDTVFYSSGDGSDIVKQFGRKSGGDLLSFQNIPNIDVVKLGKNTEFRISDGISGNAGFGSGDLLMTLQGTTGFTLANIGQSLDGTNTAQFQFS